MLPLDCDRFRCFQAMELTPIWRVRAHWPATPIPAYRPVEARSSLSSLSQPDGEPQVALPRSNLEQQVATLDWEGLEAAIRSCQACPLACKRTQAVPGVGDRQAQWLFIGEGPGREEDRLGEPFVGPAGKLLDEMLFALGLARGKNVYIANAVKCRPPLNRTPHPEEIAACFPFLARQIALVAPKIIVALGKPAAFALLNQEIKIVQARGKSFSYQGIPVVVTYHPAYLLRNPADKRKAWEDLVRARQIWQQQV